MRTVRWGGWTALAGGAALCVIGWYGVAGELRVERQLPYLASCTVPGAALIVAGALLLAHGLQPAAGTRPERPRATAAAGPPNDTRSPDGTDGGGAPAAPDGAYGAADGPRIRVPRPRGESSPEEPGHGTGRTGGRPAPPGQPEPPGTAGHPDATGEPAPPGDEPSVSRGELLSVPGGTLAHRSDCPLVAGKPQAFRVSEARLPELDPCPVCQPDIRPWRGGQGA